MRFRISIAVAVFAVVAIAVSLLLTRDAPPRYVQSAIGHLSALKIPCTPSEFDAYMSSCEVTVYQRGGHEIQTYWRNAPNEDKLEVERGSYVYGMITEYLPTDNASQRVVSNVLVYRSKLEMGADPIEKIIWSWDKR